MGLALLERMTPRIKNAIAASQDQRGAAVTLDTFDHDDETALSAAAKSWHELEPVDGMAFTVYNGDGWRVGLIGCGDPGFNPS